MSSQLPELKKELQTLKPKVTVHAECQTEDGDLLFCEECEFPAETLYELGEHVGEFHSGFRIPCDFCADIYLTNVELKHHEDEVHTIQMPEITNTDGCLGSSIMSAEESKNSTDRRDDEMFNCKFCDKGFSFRKEVMKYNKNKHIETLSNCWNFEEGACEFKENCLFKHEKRELNEKRHQKRQEMFKFKFCD